MDGTAGTREAPLSVTALANGLVKKVNDFPWFWVVGELRNLRMYGERCYGSMSDGTATVQIVVHPVVTRSCAFELEEGLEVVCRGRLTFERDRGTIRLEVAEVVPRDVGALQLAFEQLRKRLEAEGLFAEARKRPVPRFATRFGVITSARGDVIHDILDTLEQRWPGYDLVLWPVPVQGENAAERIARAIRQFPKVYPDRDVLLVGRGGGSTEDLQAFNTETVVRAISECSLPVITCVGHETDTTLADFAADRRAATPTQAAQIATPRVRADVASQLDGWSVRVAEALRARSRQLEQRVNRVASSAILSQPSLAFQPARHRVTMAADRLPHAVERRLKEARSRWEQLGKKVHLVSPLATLERGFAVVRRSDTDEVVRDAAEVTEGERLRVRLHQGSLTVEVVEAEAGS